MTAPDVGTRFHLIRHAEYALTGVALGGRAPGHALTDSGHAQAAALADSLGALRLGAVVCSPMERAQETALPIAARQTLDLTIDLAWNEVDFGDWTGQPFDILADQPEWVRWNRFRSQSRPPNGETMLDVQSRAVAALHRLRTAHPGHEVAVISHGDVLRGVLLHALGMPLDLIHRLDVAPGSRSVLTLFARDCRVEGVNLPV